MTLTPRTALIGLLLPILVGCSATTGGSAGVAPAVASTSAATRTFHPTGYRLADGAVRTIDDAQQGNPSRLRLAVGDLLVLDRGNWLPDNSPYSTALGSAVVLAVADGQRMTYQAVRPGRVEIAVGPVGHPGGCDRPGRTCADATPPPLLEIEVH